MGRARLRDLGITIGRLPTGPRNAITDVPGVLVGHRTLIGDAPRIIRTGVTMIIPRNGAIWTNYAFAGVFSFNGNGEMTGIPWIDESGMLGSPIGITVHINTHLRVLPVFGRALKDVIEKAVWDLHFNTADGLFDQYRDRLAPVLNPPSRPAGGLIVPASSLIVSARRRSAPEPGQRRRRSVRPRSCVPREQHW